MTPSAASSHPASVGTVPPAEVDASFRPVAYFFAAASALWLVAGALLSLLASVKLHSPGMMSGAAWLSFGRLFPAGWDALVYGFAGQAGTAVGLWILARASGQRLQSALLVLAGGALWNVGVLAGTIGILAGQSTGREFLEMPPGAMALLVVAAGLIGTSGWLTFSVRTVPDAYPSAWFALLALLSFVWFGTVALMTFSGNGVHGVVQVLVQRWFAGGVVRLWLGGFALAVVFHFLPAMAGRPLASRQLAVVGFWALVFFAPWAVAGHGDPFPRWVVSAGIAGQMLSMIAWMAVSLNWWKTVEGGFGRILGTPSGRLVASAAVAFVVGGLLQFVVSLQGPASTVRFTWMQQGLDWWAVGGVAILAFVGVLPLFVEQATGRRLPPALVGAHAWLTLVGVAAIAVPFVLAGVVQGTGLSSDSRTFVEVLRGSMHLVRLTSLGFTLFLLGQMVWLVALAGIFRPVVLELVTMVKGWAAPLPAKGAVR